MRLSFILLAAALRPFGFQPLLHRRVREVEPNNGFRCYEPAGRRLTISRIG